MIALVGKVDRGFETHDEIVQPGIDPGDSRGQRAVQLIERHARLLTPSIRDDGRSKILSGVTTIEEVLRVTRED